MSLPFEQLESQIPTAMLFQQFRFRQQFKRLKSDLLAASEDPDRMQSLADQFAKLQEQVAASNQQRERRAHQVPQATLDPDLPIFEHQTEITEALRDHQVVVISGATGSGKSTQIPLIALNAGYGAGGLIGHTQPRRIAARGVAARIAQQLGTALGTDVGFKIRFDDKTGPNSYIKLMTDGILLAETQSDRFLERYELIIVDEAHERSLNIDFLLGYLRRVLSQRPQLRLIITSATIDTARFAEHFTVDPERPVPIIDVEGRTFPVEIQYSPPELLADGSPREMEDHLVAVCRQLSATDDGDMLVFLPTEADIRSAAKKLRSAQLPGRTTDVLPLYARLSNDQQNQIFQPGKNRRVVLATNVAESSITVPRIRFVVDTGTARISHYAPRSKVQRLPIQAVSQASANQRAGRCGRIGPGVCVRLYSEEDFESRPRFTTPEIRRTNLASVILQTLALKLGQIDEFPFIDPPRPESIRDGYKTLFEIGAVDPRRQLTSLGRRLARMPVDPRIGRMIFAAEDENCLSEILIIAAALEIQDPRVRPPEHRQAADTKHEAFRNEHSDFLSLLNIWDFFHQLKSDLSRSRLKKACESQFLSYPLLRQWQDIHRQLLAVVRDQGLTTRSRKDDSDAIHRSLLTGLLSGIAMASQRHEYLGAGNIDFHLWPGSGVFESKPKWVVVAEIVETSRRYGRVVARIAPQWIEPLARHLTKHNFSDPHWSRKQQSAIATEQVTLFGLPIVAGRKVHYAPIDPAVARDLMIEHGLVNEELDARFDFLEHNRWLTEQISLEAAKTRNRDLVIDQMKLLEFYQVRLPQQVADTKSLQRALRDQPELDSQLRLTRQDLLPEVAVDDVSTKFPDKVQIGSMQIPIAYRFSPGATDDGATVRIPVEGIGQLDEAQTGWLVPGLMESRIVALIRSLPKSIRRNLVPAPETAAVVARDIEFGRGRFTESVARELTRIGGLPIDESMFKTEKLDSHLNINLQVVDQEGTIVAEARSISELRQQLGSQHVSTIVDTDNQQWTQDLLRDWTWDELPKEISIVRGGTELSAYPTVVDQQDGVGLRLSDSLNAAEFTSRQGLIRLFQICNRKSLKSQVTWLPNLDRHSLALSRILPAADLKQHLTDLMVRIGLVDGQAIPRSRREFEALQQIAVERISIAAQEISRWLPEFSAAAHEVELALDSLPQRFASSAADIGHQLNCLTESGFLASTPWQWLREYPRYLAAMRYRIDKLTTTPADREQSATQEVQHYWKQYQEREALHRTLGIVDSELVTYRWMLEEYRVSIFAQILGTSIKISGPRLDKQFASIRQR